MTATFQTRKDHHDRVQRVMIEIDRQLDRTWDLAGLAAVACLSPHHFQRIFRKCTGESPREHLYRRRMEYAARRLYTSSARITDIALDVGYDSPNAFCKAFHRWCGRPPRRFRRHPISMDGFASLLAGSLRPACQALDWRPTLVHHPVRQLVYIQKHGFRGGSLYPVGQLAAFELQGHLARMGQLDRVRAWLSTFPRRPRGITDQHAAIQLGVILDRPIEVEPPLQTRLFGGGHWAVFCHRGPYHFLFQSWNRAYFGALPAMGLIPRDADPFEQYLDADSDRPEEDLRTLIHVPIV